MLAGFSPLVQSWFAQHFGTPTEAQAAAWPQILDGRDTLIAAPTGSGKTLAACMCALDALVAAPLLPTTTHVLYVSPLKALSNDVEKNLQRPLAELASLAIAQNVRFPDIKLGLRTGDTPAAERARMAKTPPHIWVTTPESLYILLTSEKGRAALAHVRTVIVDEIHVMLADKRGAHLALSLERLDRLVAQHGSARPQRIGLSATQRPLERVGRFLVGHGRALPAIIDSGHARAMDIAIDETNDELAAVASGEQLGRVYDRIAQLVQAHTTTLVFVNTRRMVERVARALEERLGEDQVVAHHGSMSRELRLAAEQRLKTGAVRCAVATASLELGIDVGAVDLVVQLGSPRAIATFLQRVGRSGHTRHGLPKGRMFALTRDQLIECAALVRGVRRGNLDELHMRHWPLDVLCQQITAMCANEELGEDELFTMVCQAAQFAALPREQFDAVLHMLAEGVSERRGRGGATIFRDRVNGRLRGRKGARLIAIQNGGAIPDNANYAVVTWPSEARVGEVDEDFAIDSSAGDVFQLGGTSWRIQRIENGRVLVEDAQGAPPSIPFWFGEAPARTRELSQEVSALRRELDVALQAGTPHEQIAAWLMDQASMSRTFAAQTVAYLAAGREALGAMPSDTLIIAERFFDEAGGMQLVIHSPLGGRINRAWGLALRKRFCRSFDFELQAAATDDGIVISLGQPHSFPLDSVFGFLPSQQAEGVLVQALLDAPMFEIRWRWNSTRSLMVARRNGGKKVPPHLVRMRAADMLSVVFPQAQACQENISGDRELPNHPLVFETVRDCLVEAMDIAGLTDMLARMERGEIAVMGRDTLEPSPLCHELLNANPYAFLDDAPLEERRTRAVSLRRGLPADLANNLGALSPEALEAVGASLVPSVRNSDELHDLLLGAWMLPVAGVMALWQPWLAELESQGRARLVRDGWFATERVHAAAALWPEAAITLPSWLTPIDRETAVRHIVGACLDISLPLTCADFAAASGLGYADVMGALLALESDGAILRGHFAGEAPTPTTARDALAKHGDDDELARVQWCQRRILARLHQQTIATLRQRIEPVSAAVLMRFLTQWHRVAPGRQLHGHTGLVEIISQLQGFETAAGAWERDVLPARLFGYDPAWLDRMCFGGELVWCRLNAKMRLAADDEEELDEPAPVESITDLLAADARVLDAPHTAEFFRRYAAHTPAAKMASAGGKFAPTRSAPLALLLRRDAELLRGPMATQFAEAPLAERGLSDAALAMHAALTQRGAAFLVELCDATLLSPQQADQALWELVSQGLATADGFAGLRMLIHRRRGEIRSHLDAPVPSPAAVAASSKWLTAVKRARTRDAARPTTARTALPAAGGRWSLLPPAVLAHDSVATWARVLLARYGVVFRDLLVRESGLPPWRDLVVELRRLEARGEIMGGRFVSGFVGEQFALPEAVEELRGLREAPRRAEFVKVAATDPLNLVGILSPGPKVPAVLGNAVLYRNGEPIASLERGEVVVRVAVPGVNIDAELNATEFYEAPPSDASVASNQLGLVP
ncbi:MAG: DEAD/DEAH box helicase [Myxococcales bacterium]|nr:DEAD/DEAH box helicase [Myxococcales bacterium]